MKTITELIQIAGTGSNLIIDASKFSTSDLINLITTVGQNNTHLIIRNANKKATSDLIIMVRNYPKNVTFDFS